jgi:alpha-tubulin suppressor-like RCC1 family protein
VWKKVDVGLAVSCLLAHNNSLWCWGRNDFGQVGDGTKEERKKPVKILDDVENVELAGSHCAIKKSKELFCWGENEFDGAVGNGSMKNEPFPVKISNSVETLRVDPESTNTCILSTKKELLCWRSNNYFQLMDGTQEKALVPKVLSVPFHVDDVFSGNANTICARSGLKFYCWGNGFYGQFANGLPQPKPGEIQQIAPNKPIVSVVGIDKGLCYLFDGGGVSCAGWNKYGQLGTGNQEPKENLEELLPLPPVKTLAPGSYFLCALSTEGDVYCWGDNTFHQTGVEGVDIQTSPVKVPGVSKVISLGVGPHGSCALTEPGELICWGAPWYDFVNLLPPTVISW